jgi:hypothetical protein
MSKVRVLKNMGEVNKIKREEYSEGKLFNPIKDADGDWVISETEWEEYLQFTDTVKNSKFKFLIDANQKDHNPIITVLE